MKTNTKYIKVSVSGRHPEKSGDHFIIDLNEKKAIGLFINREFQRLVAPEFWLEEKPDYEEEMREMLEEVYDYAKKWPLDGLPSQMEDKIEELLTKLKTES
ncbi:hypothetical protein [uncultured Chryseobacterium sp.]|uniref:hypothetical protein n=1 Tax=uncultured Chryseobacterium sp. TaxID=259322 RepID=UPI0025851C41|nr:hypothetical protein [uncultured Chryseobacterium sp.]